MGDGASSASASSASSDWAPDTKAKIALGVLTSVEANSTLSQRALARQLGIALGLANAYLKRCAKKGLSRSNKFRPIAMHTILRRRDFPRRAG